MKPSAILLWGLSTLSSTGHAVKTVGQIFNVDLTTSANGGCAQNPGEQVLNQEVMDCYTLAQAGIDLLNSFNSGDDAAKRLVDSLFRMGKTPTSDAREKAMILGRQSPRLCALDEQAAHREQRPILLSRTC